MQLLIARSKCSKTIRSPLWFPPKKRGNAKRWKNVGVTEKKAQMFNAES